MLGLKDGRLRRSEEPAGGSARLLGRGRNVKSNSVLD